MSKNMSNNDIVAYEGGDYGKIMDNYNLHEITAAIANRAGKAYDAFKSIEEEVERLENNPDVVDIVATYADLQAYPTGQLTDKDVVRVLQDETHDGSSTYYRWNATTQTWTYIGESKQYSDFVGTDGTTGGQNGLVPAPVATDAGKFLNANGSWEEIDAGGITELTSADYNFPANNSDGIAYWLLDDGIYSFENLKIYQTNASSVTGATGLLTTAQTGGTYNQHSATLLLSDQDVLRILDYNGANSAWTVREELSTNHILQTTGASTTDVMSQNATTSMIFADPSTKQQIQIGLSASVGGSYGNGSIAIGRLAAVSNSFSAIAIGDYADASAHYSIALGGFSRANTQGQFDISTGTQTTSGYNSSNYRLLTGLYDPQSDHDAATKGYVDSLIATLEARIAALEGN